MPTAQVTVYSATTVAERYGNVGDGPMQPTLASHGEVVVEKLLVVVPPVFV